MAEEFKPKRGAPRGNQNARKHGFYSRVLTGADKRYLQRAAREKGLDAEINLLRVKLRSVVENDPDNVKLILQATSTLARLLRTRQSLGGSKEEQLQQAFQNVINNIGVPLGVGPDQIRKLRSQQP